MLFSPLFHYISSVTLTQRTLYNTYYNIIQHLLQHLLQRRTAKKPKRERRKPPVKNAILAQGGAGMSVDQYNAVATQEWSKNLLKCQYCDRTFREEAFKHHQNACGPGKSGSKKVGMALNTNGLGLGEVARSKQRGRGGFAGEEFPSSDVDNRVDCPYCSRKFNPSSADRHIKVCSKNQHKPTAPPTSNDAYTDDLGRRHNGRGAMASSAASALTDAAHSHSRGTRKTTGTGAAAALVLKSNTSTSTSSTTEAPPLGLAMDASAFKMLAASIDNLLELGATPQQVKQVVSRSLQRWGGK